MKSTLAQPTRFITITFITCEGVAHTVEAISGASLMQAAVNSGVPGIDAICGGDCACATCQVFIDTAWLERTGQASAQERSVLRYARGAQPNSRLSCAITLTPALDGLIVRIPEHQF